MTQVLIFSIIGLFLSASLLIQAIIKVLEIINNSISWTLPLVVSSILLIFSFTNVVIMSGEVDRPQEDDVISGKASYVESYHVINNDTIKTYTIIWKKN